MAKSNETKGPLGTRNKKIVLFSDGTGNSSSNPHKTNVWRAYQALDRRPGSGQIAYYDNGVGTSSFTPTAMLGLAFGFGLARNVKQIYGFLCRTYNPQTFSPYAGVIPADDIYGFGFSRGAFTIRIVMGLIASQGIIDRTLVKSERDLDRLITAAYRQFRQEAFAPSLLSYFLAPLRDFIISRWWLRRGLPPYDPEKNLGYVPRGVPSFRSRLQYTLSNAWNAVRGRERIHAPRHVGVVDAPAGYDRSSTVPFRLIKFLGVWDTVDAYGLPVDELTRAWDKIIWPLTVKDRNLSPRITKACHALALDEQRESFEPMLWNEWGGAIPFSRLKQVWFAGVHSNVGGGYPDDSLAYTSLSWMLDESGLAFLPEMHNSWREQVNFSGPVYDSRSAAANYYRYGPRDIEYLCNEKKPGLAQWLQEHILRLPFSNPNEVHIVNPRIHYSVFKRMIEQGSYAPINIPQSYEVVDRTGAPQPMQIYENREQAKERRALQALVWNKVWGRKVIYFVTLLLTTAYIAYPYFAPASGHGVANFLAPVFGMLTSVIGKLPELVGQIPGLSFAEGWAKAYKPYPFVFVIVLAILVLLIVASTTLNAKLKSEMREYWKHVIRPGPALPATPPHPARQWLARFLDNTLPTGGAFVPSPANRMSRRFWMTIEAAAVVVFLGLVVMFASRLTFIAADGFGAVCRASTTAPSQKFGETFAFDPNNPCYDTRHELVRGEEYRIEFEISDNWSDATLNADVNGWTDLNAYYAFTPFRRHLLAGWYQPVARVGETLFDRYPLSLSGEDAASTSRKALCRARQPGQQLVNPARSVDDEAKNMALHMDFTARRTGRLFLYVNDMMLFVPGLLGPFYSNNRGYACVTVFHLSAPEGASEASGGGPVSE